MRKKERRNNMLEYFMPIIKEREKENRAFMETQNNWKHEHTHTLTNNLFKVWIICPGCTKVKG
jgi:hypothetical protein